MEKGLQIADWRRDLKREADFETVLASKARKDGMKLKKLYQPYIEEWGESIHYLDIFRRTIGLRRFPFIVTPLTNLYQGLMDTYKLDQKRLFSTFPPKMIAAIKQARRDKILNKTRELERERRGEILPRTIHRRSKSPPAHILAKMTKEERRLDKLARHVSEVGVVGMAKMKLGHKLRNPDAWKCEVGRPEDKERLDRMEKQVRLENERRRQSVGEID
jgi:hypothetical protein